MLTKRQAEAHRFIFEYIRENGFSPSFKEIQAALGLKSQSHIHVLLEALEERGYIRKLPYKARAIEVLVEPGQVPIYRQRKTSKPPSAGHWFKVVYDQPEEWQKLIPLEEVRDAAQT